MHSDRPKGTFQPFEPFRQKAKREGVQRGDLNGGAGQFILTPQAAPFFVQQAQLLRLLL
jgi:hypothetical protein